MAKCSEDARKKARKADEHSRRRRRETGTHARGCEHWKGKKFYRYFIDLCKAFEVETDDCVEFAPNSVPGRYAKAMNDVLEGIERRQVSKIGFIVILRKLVGEWKTIHHARFASRNGKISIYIIRRNIDDILQACGVTDDEKPLPPLPPGTKIVSTEEFLADSGYTSKEISRMLGSPCQADAKRKE